MKNTLIIVIACASFVGCGKKLIPEKPVLQATSFRLDSLPVSEINIPIVVSLKPLYQEAEKNVDTLYTSPNYPDGWVQSGCDTRYKYTFRRGPLQLKASGTRLDLAFTGYYRIIGSSRVCVGNTVMSPWTPPCRCGFDEGERRVNVGFTNTLTIGNDFKARLNIVRQEPQPLDKCQVCFWGQDITSEVLKGLKEELDLARKAIADSFSVIDLKPQFQQVWNQLNEPFNLYGMGWLSINPQRLSIQHFSARQDSLYIQLGLMAQPVIRFEKPATQLTLVPNLATTQSRPGFNIFLDAVMNYDSLSNIANAQLKDKRFDFEKPVNKHIIIKNVQLYGARNEKLIIKLDFEGSEKGTAYFTGRPTYNPQTRVIEFLDLDFDIKTKNLLMNTAEWMFNRKIISELQKSTRFDLSQYIGSALTTAGSQLNREIIPGVKSTGILRDVSIIRIFPFEEHLVIRSNLSGELSVKVESIPFSF